MIRIALLTAVRCGRGRSRAVPEASAELGDLACQQCEDVRSCMLSVSPREPGRAVAPDSAREGRRSVVARKSPDSPANRPVAEKAAMVAAAAGTGSRTARGEPAGRLSVAARGAGAPVSGAAATPIRATAPSARTGGRARSAAASPTAPGSRRAAGRCRVRPTFTAVPMFPGTDRGAFGSARSRSSIRYGIATPVARPIATPVSRRPISSPGRAFHAASSPHHTFIPPSTAIWTPVM
jgi:hypothetical protein